MRARLLEAGRLRDASLLVVLAYAGLRPQEALALEWRHVRERTLLVERADGLLLRVEGDVERDVAVAIDQLIERGRSR